MKLSIKNLGFIKSGEFETNNLTIIFGKNNSGKTYLSHTAYILSKETKKIFSFFAKNDLDIKTLLEAGNGSTKIKISDIIDTNSYTTLNLVNNSGLSEHFALPQKYFAKTEIQFDFNSLYNKAIKSSFEIIIGSYLSPEEILIKKEKDSEEINIIRLKINTSHNSIFLSEDSYEYFYKYQIASAICDEIIDLDIKNPFIITSERTGIEMFQKEIDNNRSDIAEELSISRITRKSKKTNIDKIVENKLSRYSMPIADNIRILRNQYDIRKRTSTLSTKRSYLELRKSLRKITKGSFKVDQSGDVSYLMDAGTSAMAEIPLYVASSSIKSMALMDLYINHIASADDTLIIDEPELNLHPDNQILMAELIVRLVNIGVNVIMTTHSDYIVREINNRIRLHAASKDSPLFKSLIESNADTIDYRKVSIYNITDEGVIEKGIVTKTGMENIIFDDAIIESSEREELIISLLGD